MSATLACTCPHCGASLNAPAAYAGRPVTCLACRMDFPADGPLVHLQPPAAPEPPAATAVRLLVLIPFIALGAWIISKGIEFVAWISSL